MNEQFTFFYTNEFSQWYLREFELDGVIFNCAEQKMMWDKAMLFGDQEIAEKIMKAKHPGTQKSLGRQVRNFDATVWKVAARPLVYRNNVAKFSQHRDLFRLLIDTRGTTLVEASPIDTIWGIGLVAADPRALDRTQWRGLNWLGEVETNVRNDFTRVRDHLAALDPRNLPPPPAHAIV